MTQHTAGPWTIDESPSPVYGSNGTLVAEGVRIGGIATCYTTGTRSSDKNRANARLIAAAPELLEALKRLIELAEDPENERDSDLVEIIHWDHIRALITKAEGGTNA
jgi:hypothetical protein